MATGGRDQRGGGVRGRPHSTRAATGGEQQARRFKVCDQDGGDGDVLSAGRSLPADGGAGPAAKADTLGLFLREWLAAVEHGTLTSDHFVAARVWRREESRRVRPWPWFCRLCHGVVGSCLCSIEYGGLNNISSSSSNEV